MLVTWRAERLHLLDVGGHNVVAEYTYGKFYADALNPPPAARQFWPDADGPRFFARNPCLDFAVFGKELDQEWLYDLSLEQEGMVCELAYLADETFQQNGYRTAFIVGGPGTGKTSVLLNLLKYCHEQGYEAAITVTDALAEYIKASVPEIDFERFRFDAEAEEPPDIHLIDDPEYEHLADFGRLAVATEGAVPLLRVYAFDPLQLRFAPRDDDLAEWVSERDIAVFSLTECYRQKANVGEHVKEIADTIALSTPFLASKKVRDFQTERMGVTELSNGIEFPNPHGYLETYETATAQDVRKELARVKSRPLWRHWTPILAVFDSLADVPTAVRKLLEEANAFTVSSKIGRDWEDWMALSDVKGLEFQHVFVFLRRELYEQIEHGFRGSGQAAYHDRRLLRIPFSRAKDSLVTFVF